MGALLAVSSRLIRHTPATKQLLEGADLLEKVKGFGEYGEETPGEEEEPLYAWRLASGQVVHEAVRASNCFQIALKDPETGSWIEASL